VADLVQGITTRITFTRYNLSASTYSFGIIGLSVLTKAETAAALTTLFRNGGIKPSMTLLAGHLHYYSNIGGKYKFKIRMLFQNKLETL
jgi:hypothetical protein